jgi:DNA polymerase-3 subunit beta
MFMKFTTQSIELQKALSKVMPAVPSKPPFEVLEFMHLELVDNLLTITTSDLELNIRSNLYVTDGENGAILVPAKKFHDIVNVLNATKDVTFECDTDEHIVKLVCGKSKYQIGGMDAEDYIELPSLFSMDIPTEDEASNNVIHFKREVANRLANKTSFAVSQDEHRPNMGGVFFQFRENYVNAVSTDSFRLVRATEFADDKPFPNELDILVPVRAIDLLRKVDTDIVMLYSEHENYKQLRIDIDNTIVVTRLINERFPKYEAIIPTATSCQLSFDVNDMMSAIKEISPVITQYNKKCTLDFKDGVLKVMASDDGSGGEAVSEIAAELLDAEEFKISFNINYLKDMIGNVPPDAEDNIVQMFFVNADKAALVKPKSNKESLIMILMPIRMN